MKSLSDAIMRYRQWQQDYRRHIARPSRQRHHCRCCETEYTGNFCPQCGQNANVGRITWHQVWQGLVLLWGIDFRPLPYTLWQLLLRPGYLIRDYISGRRQASFPPIKMLALLAVVVFIAVRMIDPEESDLNDLELEGKFKMTECAILFFQKHYDVAMMFFCSSLIVPTWFVFRFSPRCSHHTLPEGFYIQVFNSVTGLLLMIVFWIVIALFDPSEEDKVFLSFVSLMIILAIYRNYHQLFGYGYWATLWRVIAVVVAALMLLGALVVLDHLYYFVSVGDIDKVISKSLPRVASYLAVVVALIGVSYFISRHTARRRAAGQKAHAKPQSR